MKKLKIRNQENIEVYRKNDHFAAWPFNGGVFKYVGDEIVIGFQSKYCEYRKPYQVGHGYSYPGKPSKYLLARSFDGGITWKENDIRELNEIDNIKWRFKFDKENLPKPSAVDFKNPDLMIINSIVHLDNGGVGYCLISEDRGRSFQGPFKMPWCRYAYAWGRPDYIIRNDGACILFNTVYNGKEDNAKPVTFISKNGGISWKFFSEISPQSSENMQIMPSGVLRKDGEIVVAVRCQRDPGTLWSECHASKDGGRTWSFRSRINDMGSPCHLLLLDDDRLLATYGYRDYPFGIRASISEDAGKTWDNEIIIRDDGGSWDLGYPKSIQLDNGEIFTTYYFNDKNDAVNLDGGVRYIAATKFALDDFEKI
jgi:hypothetical protein